MILITGGAGYIGSHTNKLLSECGENTLVFDNLSTGYRLSAQWGEFVLGNLNNLQQLHLCFEKFPIEAVIHFASSIEVKESVANPHKYYSNNLNALLNLLNCMIEFQVPYIIFSSSASVYGIPCAIPISEDHPLSPINPYGWSKRMGEQIIKDYEKPYGIHHVNLRYFNASGADPEAEIGEDHKPETHLIPLTIDAAIGKQAIKIFGDDYDTKDGTCIRDYVHVNDIAKAHFLALEYLRDGGKSDIFNIGNGNGFSVLEVIQTTEEITGKSIQRINHKRREGDPSVLVADSSKIKKVLKWKPSFPDLPSIIETAWRWRTIGLIEKKKEGRNDRYLRLINPIKNAIEKAEEILKQ